MKGHLRLLAVSVLYLAALLSPGITRAQGVDSPAEPAPAPLEPAAVDAVRDEPPPSTPVDAAPPPPVHTEPVSPPPAPAPAPPSPSVREPSLRERLGAPRYRDAHHDRLLFAPTAETHPRGSFYASSYYIVVLQVGYAVTDDTQISLTATPPLGEEGILPGDLSVKTVLLRAPRVTLAAIASASGILGFEEVSGFLGRAGGVVTFCADADACRLSFSMSTNVALAGPASILFSGAGFSYRAGGIVSLVAELDTALPLAEPVGEANGLLGGAAVRLSGRAWGVDLGLMRAGKARAGMSGFFPFLAATYRYAP